MLICETAKNVNAIFDINIYGAKESNLHLQCLRLYI